MYSRDTQRKKCYAAERTIFDDNKNSKPLTTVKDVEKFVKRLQARKSLQARFGEKIVSHPISVGDGRACRNALACGASTIKIPRWARTEWVVCHEVAHIIVYRILRWTAYHTGEDGMRIRSAKNVAAHGREYCHVYLQVVRAMMGTEAHDALRAAFKAGKVKYKLARKG